MLGGVYDGRCRQQQQTTDEATALRLRIDQLTPAQLMQAENYRDIFQGWQQQTLAQAVGDFILRRKDSLFAYQLAVVVDDIQQQITHVIRGYDLLSSTPRPGLVGNRKAPSFITNGSLSTSVRSGTGIYSMIRKFGMQADA